MRKHWMVLVSIGVIHASTADAMLGQSSPQTAPVPSLDSLIYVRVLDAFNPRRLPIAQAYTGTAFQGSAFVPGGLAARMKSDSGLLAALADSARHVGPALRDRLVRWRDVPWFDTDTIYSRPRPDGSVIIYQAVALSRIGYNSTLTRAALVLELICGGLCGGADIILMQRVGGDWQVAERVEYFVR
jgi:hypothetical protein